MIPVLKMERVFRFLIVDDYPSAALLLQEVMKNLQHRYEVHVVEDGAEALDFLYRRGSYVEAPHPDLILMDMNMPRLGGLETVTAIKNDPELCVIPVIMFSTVSSPQDVRKSYQVHANCYVEKPTDLERFVKLIQAIEAFWMDFALLPSGGGSAQGNRQMTDSKVETSVSHSRPPGGVDVGPQIAPESSEVSSRAMHIDDLPAEKATPPLRNFGCEENNHLLEEFGSAVQEILKLHEQQFVSIAEGDTECHRFDLLIHMANENKQRAKYAYLRHLEAHGCSNTNALKQTRT